MLVRGNNKVGKEIYLFNLPSARRQICRWLTPICKRLCYDRRLEKFRPSVAQARWKNYRCSLQADFPHLMIALVEFLQVKLLRVHGGGEFYSAVYARKWLEIMRRCRKTRFYFYTRAWRDGEMRGVLEEMAGLRNVRVWYSLDRETGVPEQLHPRVRLAYLQSSQDDEPPEGVHLVFRPQELRRRQATRVGGVRVCPSENGVKYREKIHCGNCSICHRELVASRPVVLTLPLVSKEME